MIDVDLATEKLVKLPRPTITTSLKLEESVRIAKTRQCLAYTLRLKLEEASDQVNLAGLEEQKAKPNPKKGEAVKDDGPLLTTG